MGKTTYASAIKSGGRTCSACKKRLWYDRFRPNGRTCIACMKEGQGPRFDCICLICQEPFEGRNAGAKYCCTTHAQDGAEILLDLRLQKRRRERRRRRFAPPTG